jgi:hypothetical protein
VRGAGRRLLALHLAFVPSLFLVTLAYTSRPPIPVAFEGGVLRRTPAAGREARLYGWIRAHTPLDAVIVQDPGPEGRQCTGNTSELPAFTGRALFTDYFHPAPGEPRHYLVAPYRDASLRVDLARRLAHGRARTAEDDRYLAALARPIFVVSFDAAVDEAARLAGEFGAPVFEADGVRVHSWRPHE